MRGFVLWIGVRLSILFTVAVMLEAKFSVSLILSPLSLVFPTYFLESEGCIFFFLICNLLSYWVRAGVLINWSGKRRPAIVLSQSLVSLRWIFFFPHL